MIILFYDLENIKNRKKVVQIVTEESKTIVLKSEYF